MSASPPAIEPTLTIREALTRYPQTAAVFARHGLAGCGGEAGPLEPIDQFARLHHVDLGTLLAELEASARAATPAPPSVPSAAPWESYRLYLKTSVALALTAGFGIGLLAVLGRAGGPDLGVYWLPLIQAHGQVQLLGWIGLFVVGIAYHVVPRFRSVAPPSAQVVLATYGLLLGAVLVRALGQPLAVASPMPAVFTVAALLQLAASVLFASTLLRWLTPTRGRWEGYEPYLLAAGGWLVLAGLFQTVIAAAADAAGGAIVANLLTEPYLVAMFHGFALMATLGVTRRAIPLFMGLRPTSARLALAACALLNTAVALEVAGSVGSAHLALGPWRGVTLLGAVLAVVGAATYVWALHLFERAPMAPGLGQPRRHEPYVRTAYGWLLFSLGLGAGLAVWELTTGTAPTTGATNAARHALALGFLSLLIFGVASRIVPVFGGVILWRPRLLGPLYVVFNLGVALRVTGELLGNTDTLGRCLVAASGVLAYGGLALFALVLWRTLDARPPIALPRAANAPGSGRAVLAENLTVAEVLARTPAALPVFLAHGFTPLANPLLRAAMASRVTVGQAARMQGVALGPLLADLRTAADPNTTDAGAGACPERESC